MLHVKRGALDFVDAVLGHLRISYTLEPDGGGTRFVRDLDLPAVSAAVEAVMDKQSAAGLAALRALLEREIPAEGRGPDGAGQGRTTRTGLPSPRSGEST